MTPAAESDPHPLDGCDPDECYKTMMAERTALITARREAEDNLIKTVVQLAAALIALIAGFISQSNVELSGWALLLFGVTQTALVLSILGGLTEQHFSSKAYLEQQKSVEDFYQRKISTFSDAPSNKWVRRAQLTSFLTFVAALLSLSAFALVKAGEKNVRSESASPSSAAASTAAATTPSTAASTAATPSAAAASTGGTAAGSNGRQRNREIGGAIDASATAEEVTATNSPARR